ncbi:hypothetical protein EF910_16455 [Streptomyces sp. WAC07149]|nr:hypothetical protein EF910_16455 [Streptomyces sp. WAC07149]
MSDEQGSHFYVLTLQSRNSSVCTVSGTYTPAPGATRNDVYTQLRADLARQYPSMENATVLHFSIEPNQL